MLFNKVNTNELRPTNIFHILKEIYSVSVHFFVATCWQMCPFTVIQEKQMARLLPNVSWPNDTLTALKYCIVLACHSYNNSIGFITLFTTVNLRYEFERNLNVMIRQKQVKKNSCVVARNDDVTERLHFVFYCVGVAVSKLGCIGPWSCIECAPSPALCDSVPWKVGIG